MQQKCTVTCVATYTHSDHALIDTCIYFIQGLHTNALDSCFIIHGKFRSLHEVHTSIMKFHPSSVALYIGNNTCTYIRTCTCHVYFQQTHMKYIMLCPTTVKLVIHAVPLYLHCRCVELSCHHWRETSSMFWLHLHCSR